MIQLEVMSQLVNRRVPHIVSVHAGTAGHRPHALVGAVRASVRDETKGEWSGLDIVKHFY